MNHHPMTLFTATNEWVDHLATHHYFPVKQVIAGPDAIAVYRDTTHQEPLILILADESTDPEMAIKRAAENNFSFVGIGNPLSPKVFKIDPTHYNATPETTLPSWMPNHPRTKLVPKTTQLLPFASEGTLRAAFRACHHVVYKTLANDPAATFDLLLLILTAKLLDERSERQEYRFAIIARESLSATANRFNQLLHEAAAWLDQELANQSHVPILDGKLAHAIFAQFQDYSLKSTAETAGGTDILGAAYETIVGSTFRGELGSYFTPRTIADFIARFIDVRSGKIFDPACGSAGLLLALRRLHGDADTIQYWGNDLNPRMVRAAKVNFLLHGLDHRQVLQGNGTNLERILSTLGVSKVPNGYWWEAIVDGPFDAVVANPPFAGHEKDESILARIESAGRRGEPRSLNRTFPFIETIVASLRVGGIAGLVLPTSILNAEEKSFQLLRELLLTKTEILAIIGLPEKAFVHTDCGVHGCLLFLKRVASPRSSYDVFVDWAQHLGYDRLGRYKRENDFPAILARYRQKSWPASNRFSISILREHGRWDPAWLHVVKSLPAPGDQDFIPLTDLLEVRNARISRREIDDDTSYRYFEVADTDLITGEIDAIQESTGFELRKKNRIRNRVRAGDILLPNHRDSLIAKGAPTGRSAAIVGPQIDGVLTTDRFLVLRPLIDPLLLQQVLNSAGVRHQIVARCRGAASLDIRERTLASVLVPRSLVEGDESTELAKATYEVRKLRKELRSCEEKLRARIESQFLGSAAMDFRPASRSGL
jgi:type I restriction-modification system DNA methylase subunit